MCVFKKKDPSSEHGETATTTSVATVENGGTGSQKIPNDMKKGRPADFEEALTKTTFGKFNYFLITVAGLVLSNVLLETLAISFILPVTECDLHLTTQQKGVLSAIGFAGIITSSHLWGFLADTTGRRRVIGPTLILGFLMTLISCVMKNFWLLVVLRYLNGIFISGGSATIYAYLGEFHTTKTRSRAIMGASFIFGLAGLMLPALAWAVINDDWKFYIPVLGIVFRPWRLFMLVCGVPGLICALCMFKLPESPKFVLAQGNEEEAIEILKGIFAINTGRNADEYDIKSLEHEIVATAITTSSERSNPAITLLRSMWNQTIPIFMRPNLQKTFMACILQFGIFATSNGMYMWFPEILNHVGDFTKRNPEGYATICEILQNKNTLNATNVERICNSDQNDKLEDATFLYSILLEVLYVIGFAVIGIIINAVGKLSILFAVLCGCGACGVAAGFVNIPNLALYLYMVLLLCGLGVVVVNAATVDLFPTNLRAMAVCISLMVGRLGSVVGSNLMGILLDYNCAGGFLASGISLIVCGFLGFLIPRPPKTSLPTPRVSLTSLTGH